MLEAHPEGDIAVAAVWQDVLRTDTVFSALQASNRYLPDDRVRHFYDARARWKRRLPRPDDWRHQLGSDEATADPRFRVGASLAADLERLAARFLEEAESDAR